MVSILSIFTTPAISSSNQVGAVQTLKDLIANLNNTSPLFQYPAGLHAIVNGSFSVYPLLFVAAG